MTELSCELWEQFLSYITFLPGVNNSFPSKNILYVFEVVLGSEENWAESVLLPSQMHNLPPMNILGWNVRFVAVCEPILNIITMQSPYFSLCSLLMHSFWPSIMSCDMNLLSQYRRDSFPCLGISLCLTYHPCHLPNGWRLLGFTSWRFQHQCNRTECGLFRLASFN